MEEPIYAPDTLKYIELHRKLINDLRGRKKINVVFIVSSLTMWQHQQIYDLMVGNKFFNPVIVFVPFLAYSEEENMQTLLQLRKYFSARNTPFLVYDEMDFSKESFRELFNPDILFYPQWYNGNYDANVDISSFFDRLICLIPYGICITQDLFCDFDANNFAWKQYQTSPIHLEIIKRQSKCRGNNVVIVGYPKADVYFQRPESSPWKKQDKVKKKIIWAPHFTITENITALNFSHFLQMHEIMWKLANSYKETVQFAFKPHPRLMTELYKHPDWGKERTNAYYDMWSKGDNTQLETGNYEELFKTSDAMIHDCGSFMAEYHYIQKPVFFITNDPDKFKKAQNLSEIGCRAIDACYVGDTNQIPEFIDKVVISNEDPMRQTRKKFLEEVLCQPLKKTSSQLIFEDICNELYIPYKGKPLEVITWLKRMYFTYFRTHE